jgi:hypothetical protein
MGTTDDSRASAPAATGGSPTRAAAKMAHELNAFYAGESRASTTAILSS